MTKVEGDDARKNTNSTIEKTMGVNGDNMIETQLKKDM